MAAENVLATQVTLGMLGAGFLQFLKTRSWIPFVNKYSAGINHVIMLATAAAGGLGISFAWTPSTHTLAISNLSLAAMAGAVWVWGKQWAVQFLIHRNLFGPVALNGAALKALNAGSNPAIKT
jgi:hypothetical protein